jgi:hypothetical protein
VRPRLTGTAKDSEAEPSCSESLSASLRLGLRLRLRPGPQAVLLPRGAGRGNLNSESEWPGRGAMPVTVAPPVTCPAVRVAVAWPGHRDPPAAAARAQRPQTCSDIGSYYRY